MIKGQVHSHSAASASEELSPELKQQQVEDRKLLNYYHMICQALRVESLT